jgi:hypothetical protein
MDTTQILELIADVEPERTVIEVALERRTSLPGPKIDMRSHPAAISDSLESSFSADVIEAFIDRSMSPSLFGIGWKIIDILIERAWDYQGGKSRPTIDKKIEYVKADCSAIAVLLGGDAEVAERIAALYGNTKELRHALTHRRLSRGADGRIEIPDGSFLSVQEMKDFSQLAKKIADCLQGNMSRRSRSAIAFLLNRLARIHDLSVLDEAYLGPTVPVVLINAINLDGEWYVDTTSMQQRVRSFIAGCPFADVEIYFPGSDRSVLRALLENLPIGRRVSV